MYQEIAHSKLMFITMKMQKVVKDASVGDANSTDIMLKLAKP